MSYVCSCGAECEQHLAYCPNCMRVGSYQPKVVVRNRTVSKGYTIVSGKELLSRARAPETFTGVWADLFGDGFALPAFIVMYGMQGTMKSVTSFRLAHDWGGKAIYHSVEMGLGPTTQSLLQFAESWDFDLSAPVNWEQLRAASVGYSLVVIDSLQHLRLSAEAIRSEFVNAGVTVIGVSQINKDGTTKGGTSYGHEADIVVEMTGGGGYRFHKHRLGDLKEGKL